MKDKEWFKTENEYYKKNYNYMVSNQVTLNRMKRYKDTPKKSIQNIPFYYILANPFYQRDFLYFPVALGETRHEYIIDGDSDEDNDKDQSDFVNHMLNLAYLKPEYAE